MAQIYTQVIEANGTSKQRWLDIKNYQFDEDGILQWFSYISPSHSKEQVCVLNRKDMEAQDWINIFVRTGSGTAIGFAFTGPLGIIGGVIGFLSFLKSKNLGEGYYNVDTKTVVHNGRIHKSNSSHFRH